MDRDTPPREGPFPSIEGGCLAALASALAAPSLQAGAERLLSGLLAPLGASGGLVVLRTREGAGSVLASRDVPRDWVKAWETADARELDARVTAGCLRQRFRASESVLDAPLHDGGYRALWVLPLRTNGRPAGALALCSRNEEAFPRDVRGTGDAVASAFAGWVEAWQERAAGRPSGDAAGPAGSPTEALATEPDLAVVGVAADGTIASWPAGARRLLGWSPDEVAGREASTLFAASDHPELVRRLGTAGASGKAPRGEWPVTLRSHDGRDVPCSARVLHAAPEADAAAPPSAPVWLVLRDRRAEAGADAWLRWSQALLSVQGGSTVVLDPGGRIRELGQGWNPSGGTAQWLGKHFADLLENDRREVLSCLRAAANAGEWSGRLVASGRPIAVTLRAVRDERGNLDAIVGARRSAAGDHTGDLFRRIPLGLVLLDPQFRIADTNPELAAICGADALPVDPAGLDVRSLAAFQTRSAQTALDELAVAGEIDHPEVRLGGSGDRAPVRLRGGRLRDAAGHTTGYLLTLASRAGEADVERHLMRAQKMESIGNLAAGLAHDFGNFIAVILGKAGMLRVKLPSDPHITGDLSDIETAAKRAQHLSQELMRFARGGRNRMSTLDVRKLIEEVGALIRTSVGRRIRVQIRLHDETPTIRGDEVELQQVIMNLCLNARDAMPNGGTLVIDTRPLSVEERAHLGPDVTDGVRLVVSDTGDGIPSDVVDRIFEPFFTTKEESQRGTGLGLAMVYGTVRRHGGTIDVRSRPGEGTRFEIFLPAAGEGAGAPPADARRILVVDDEPAFREMIRLILEEDGHVVNLAANGIEALRTLRAEWQTLALVILDLRMPGLDGLGVLEEIRRLTPTLPVLATTGYAGDEEKEEALRRGAASVLEKPYRVAQLRAALAGLLGPSSAGVGGKPA